MSNTQWTATLTSAAALNQFKQLVASHHVGVLPSPSYSMVCADAPIFTVVLVTGEDRTDLSATECSQDDWIGNLTGDVAGFVTDLAAMVGHGP